MNYHFPRGSVWRRWDLHLHTPDSFDYDDKTVTNKQIIAALKKAEISVVAITDHHLINPERIEELQAMSAPEAITVLPGIELRSELGGSESIHFIGIFPESCNLREIWTELQAKCGLHPTKVSEVGDDKVYCDLRETAILIDSLGGLVSVHAGRKSNSIERITNALPHKEATKLDIANNVNIFEVGRPEDGEDYRQIVFPNIGRQFPLIVGSDNHNAKDYHPRHSTWIKADPTFLGLQQTCYESSSRVRISPSVPDQRPGYKIIDAVRFVPGLSQTSVLPPDWILLNPHLNSVIGGKSSGKSLLLYYIAKTLQPERIDDVNETLVPKLEYDLEADPKFRFEVRWGDGHISVLDQPDDSPRPITFIPQTYLNILAERRKSELNALVESMLVDASQQFAEHLAQTRSTVERLQGDVAQDTVQLFQIIKQLGTLRGEMADLGDKKAIKKHVGALKKQLKALRDASKFSKDEEKEYDRLIKNRASLNQQAAEARGRATTYSRAKETVDTFVENLSAHMIEAVADDLFSDFDPSIAPFQIEIQNLVIGIAAQVADAARPLINDGFAQILTLELLAIAAQNQVKSNEKKLGPFTKKVGDQKKYLEISKELEGEENQLSLITAKEKEIKAVEKQVMTAKTRLMKDYCDMMDAYLSVTKRVDDFDTVFADDSLQLAAYVTFDQQRFRANFVEAIDRRTPLRRQFSEVFDSEDNYSFDVKSHGEEARVMMDSLLDGKVTCRSGHSVQDVVGALVADNFNIDYTIIQDGDDMLRMSPGKRGIILFQLFLHLSRSTDPLLIDQPEDNLDNRTVYEELNEFIKNRKTQRQIIMVSHNPNLVVSTDSEEVIVANQSGQTRAGHNRQFDFEYVSGGIECSFEPDDSVGVLQSRGIRQHVCEILEGGEEAFLRRERKYGLGHRVPSA